MNFDTQIKTQAWRDDAYAVWSSLENSTIQILNPAARQYNPATGKNEDTPETVFWGGPARVQVIHIAMRDRVDAYDRVAQRYQIQIAPNVVGIKDTMTLKVTATELNQSLTTYDYKITEMFNSDGSFETTLYAIVNSARG